MKRDSYKRRFYRDWVGVKDLYRIHVVVKETDLDIFTDKPIDCNYVEQKIRRYRWHIESYVDKDRRFLAALKPISVELHAPGVVKKMAQAAALAGVGPMAAVAGTLAQMIGKDLLRKGCREVIVENGGDIFLKVRKKRNIGLYAGKDKAWRNLCIVVKPQDTPLGICSSSGTIGHSLSFGKADIALVIAKNAALADAAATAVGNRACSIKSLADAVKFARSIRGVRAVAVIFKDTLCSWGKIHFKRRN